MPNAMMLLGVWEHVWEHAQLHAMRDWAWIGFVLCTQLRVVSTPLRPNSIMPYLYQGSFSVAS